ncbi:hypothetical protein BRARA_E00070 [Brassica rapa]|uniref:DUF4283 domain-containing protein n=1 Tax=Brassica campestris TaxID=3711 RepID=A0A397Z5F4_BRACM|nr:hypothetical protein BRARA_E00070 [Brassica rapa]
MDRRYNRLEKGKGQAPPELPAKRPPVRIPANDDEDLIEANRLTIIGRVTNPTIQKPKAVLDFMTQVWNLEGKIESRALGLDKFQVKFISEHDLVQVLEKGPYHFKKWMLLLQRWEPTVSNNFPSSIFFHVRIHGIPLHHWHKGTILTIGKELGACTLKDEKEAKIWVEVDGLNPLAMNLEIELPSGDVTEVEFEYIKIEKHCFTCFSLFHEENECPYRPLNYLPPKERNLGITQRLALQRIEAEKQRHDDRRGYRRPEAPRVPQRSAENSYTFSSRHRDRDYNRRYQSRREDHTREQSILSRTARSNTEYHRTNTPSFQYRIVERNSTNGSNANSPAPVQNDSRLTGHEDQRASPIISIASPIPNATIDITPSRALKDRLGSPKGFCNFEKEISGSRERRSALERLSEPSPPARRIPTFEKIWESL